MRVILGSASPRRQELLRSIGVEFAVVPADIDEGWTPGEHPVAYVERIATAKAAAVAAFLGDPDDAVILTADTTVDLDGTILAKPVDDDDARAMLRALAGRNHQVHTAVVARLGTDEHRTTVTTDVSFVPLTDAEIDWCLSLGEHRDKAGAYGMQSAGGVMVHRIDGSPSNVIGLPLAETIRVLQACGVDPLQPRAPIS
ncbi:MAG: Maf family protein [Ilumatobacteraceae bacterium]